MSPVGIHSSPGRRALARSAITLTALMVATALHAQEFELFKTAFKSVHSVTLFWQGASLASIEELTSAHSRCRGTGICGAGIEVLIDATSPTGNPHYEVGLGASFLHGFGARDTTLELRGAVRSFPTISAYASWDNILRSKAFQPYLGMGFGLTELWNTQVYDRSLREYSIKAQTFELSGTFGVYVEHRIVNGFFAEVSYRRRRFTSVDWGLPTGVDVLPATWPRDLNLSGWQGAIGWQFDLREKKDPPQPPEIAGSWMLTHVNGQPLPAVLTQRRLPDNPNLEREEVLGGSIIFSEDGGTKTYSLLLQTRTSTLAPDAKDGGVLTISEPDTARYRDNGVFQTDARGRTQLLSLRAGDAKPLPVQRADDDLVVMIRGTAHLLRFRKVRG